jgi:hypothetical protein
LADPPEIGISKISKDANKKVVRRFPRQLPLDGKAENKMEKYSLWDMALVCVGPDRANIPHYLKAGYG